MAMWATSCANENELEGIRPGGAVFFFPVHSEAEAGFDLLFYL